MLSKDLDWYSGWDISSRMITANVGTRRFERKWRRVKWLERDWGRERVRERAIERDWRKIERDKRDLDSSINPWQNVSSMTMFGFQEDIWHMGKPSTFVPHSSLILDLSLEMCPLQSLHPHEYWYEKSSSQTYLLKWHALWISLRDSIYIPLAKIPIPM